MSNIPGVPLSSTPRDPRRHLRAALIVAAYLCAFIILDLFSHQFEELRGIVAWYPPAGITYTLLLAFGVRFAPAVTMAFVIGSLFIYRMPQPPYLLLLWAFIISLIYGVAAAFLRHRIRFDWHLRKLRDVSWLVVTTVFVSALLAVLSVSSSALSSDMPRSEVLRAIFVWWIGETVGILTVTPFLLIHVIPGLKLLAEGESVRLPARRSIPRPTLSVIGQAFSIALMFYWVFGARGLNEFRPMYLITLPLIWIALDHGFKGVTTGIVALNFGVTLAMWFFRFDLTRLGELQLLMIVNCIVGLFMSAAVTERKQAEEELTIANQELLFQNEEKEKRAAELAIANKELAFQNEEKEKRATELIIANKELAFQNEGKEKRAAELIVANKELLFQNEEKEKRAAELIIANEEIVRRLQNIRALHKIDQAIAGSFNLNLTLNVILEQVKVQLNVDAAAVLLLDPYTQALEYAAGHGFRTEALQHTHLRLGEGYAGRAALERKLMYIPDLRGRKTDFLRSPYFSAEGFVAYYGAPLITKGGVKGVLEVFHRAPLASGPDWVSFLETLAGQAAIAVDNAQLFNNLQRSKVDLALAYDATIEGWSHALDLRDRETEGHTLRVTEMTERLARAMGISEKELVQVRRGALLHDIGKMGVPDSILHKPGPLTDEEWIVMRQHPQHAYDMLSPINYLRRALDIPHCHHEKWDGTGYPRGLKGEQIPLAARLFAIVDVWDALHSDRPYRAAWPEEKVIEYLQAESGAHFDPKVVKVFLTVMG